MNILPIITVPNPILKQETVEVKQFNNKLKNTIQDMFKTMHHSHGVGLAAPQIGILEKFFVIEYENFKKAFINPKITPLSGSEIMEEGCLSIPGINIDIERATTINVEAQNENGEHFTLKAHDFIARIIQHENDHLYGRLITDNKEYSFDFKTMKNNYE